MGTRYWASIERWDGPGSTGYAEEETAALLLMVGKGSTASCGQWTRRTSGCVCGSAVEVDHSLSATGVRVTGEW